MQPPVEKRRHERVSVELRCAFVGTSPVVERWIGVTQNISRQGLLIRWPRGRLAEEVLRVGRSVWVEVDWPTENPSGKTYLRCQGKVVRISKDPETGATLVAVYIRRASLHRGSGSVPVAGESQHDGKLLPPSTATPA